MKIACNDFAAEKVGAVFLDGVEQVSVQWFDISAGALERGKRLPEGEEPPVGYRAVGKNRILFGGPDGDFVLETVHGRVEIEWVT